MKLARIRRVLLLIFIIIVILPSIIPIATSASASAPASARPNVSMEEDPAVPAGSTASSQSSARRHKRNKGLSKPVAAQISGYDQDPGSAAQDHCLDL